MDLPIGCTLPEAEMRERRRMILDAVRRAAVGVTKLPLGYAYRFETNAEVLVDLGRLIELERRCCPFLTFAIIAEAGHQPVRLEITGPLEASAVIADLFGS